MNTVSDKKGFEKAIEIFIFLFLIIVVATLVLRMFKSELSDKQETLGELERQESIDQNMRRARAECQARCEDAVRDECSPVTVTAYCGHNVGPLDVTGNKEEIDWTLEIFPGVSICEQNIPCPLLTECTCSGARSIDTCADTMCAYWTEIGAQMGVTPSQALVSVYNVEGCTEPAPLNAWNPPDVCT